MYIEQIRSCATYPQSFHTDFNASPKFTITLLKSHLPPNFARFSVPMGFNKLDLRDYLFHAYNVRAIHVRSSITQGKASKNQKGQLKRDPPKKYMTAQLLEPFVWPEEPWVKEGVREEDWEGFQRGVVERTEDYDTSGDGLFSYDNNFKHIAAKHVPSREHRTQLAEQARELLRGETRWQSTAAVLNSEEFQGRKEPRKRGTGGQD